MDKYDFVGKNLMLKQQNMSAVFFFIVLEPKHKAEVECLQAFGRKTESTTDAVGQSDHRRKPS